MASVTDLLQDLQLNKSVDRACNDAESLNTLTGATGSLTLNLSCLYNQSERRRLRRIAVSSDLETQTLKGEWKSLQQRLEEAATNLIDELHQRAPHVSEALREILGATKGEIPNESDEPMHTKRKFFSLVCTKQTRKDYARRMAQSLRLQICLLDERVRKCCNIHLDAGTLEAIAKFKTSMDIQDLLLTLIGQNRGNHAVYNNEVLCLLPIAHLVSQDNSFTSSESAQKSISAIKYFCRGCVLLRVQSMKDANGFSQIHHVKNLRYFAGATQAFACLVRLHKGVCAMKRCVMDRVLMHVGHEELYVDGVDFSPRLLGENIKQCFEKSRFQLKRLLMGFAPKNLSTTQTGTGIFDTNHELLEHVLSSPELHKQFFTGKVDT